MTRLAAAAALLCLVLAIPVEAGVPEPEGYRLDDYNAPVPDTVAGGETVDTAALKTLVAGGRAVLVDVLPAPRRPPSMRADAPWLPEPRRDIPGSIWLPDIGRGAIPPTLQAWMQRELDRAAGGDRSRPIVFYCRAECWMSWNAAKRAVALGYRKVLWYPDGPEGWEDAGLPLVEAQPTPFK